MSVILAVATAIVYGFADFFGGLASRRTTPLAVTAGSQLTGLLLAPVLLVVFVSPFSAAGLFIGGVAGVFGGLGLALYFTAMRDGNMGVVSPLSAVAAAGVPIGMGVISGERPGALAVAGILIALPAIYLAAKPGPEDAHAVLPAPGVISSPLAAGARLAGVGHRLPAGVLLGMASGVAFGCFFGLLDLAPADSGAWPLLGAKVGSVVVVVVLARLRDRPLVPARPAWSLVVASGVLDMSANMLFLLAARAGLLSLVSPISAQYPVVVVLLSVVVLGERVIRSQQVGIGLALVAVLMVSFG